MVIIPGDISENTTTADKKDDRKDQSNASQSGSNQSQKAESEKNENKNEGKKPQDNDKRDETEELPAVLQSEGELPFVPANE